MNDSKNKLITIGITAYKEGEYLQKAWDSVANQTDNRWEAVMVLDGDADKNTTKIFDFILHPFLTKIKLDSNHGNYYTRTLAIENSKTDWYCNKDNNKTTFVLKEIDYQKGYISRTPDNDKRVMNPHRPLSIVLDAYK